METSPWRQRKSSSSAKMDSATEILHGSSRRIKAKGRMVLQGSGIKPAERARKSLNEKLDTVVFDSRAKDLRVSVNGGEGEEEMMFLRAEGFGVQTGENVESSSPSRDASDELLRQLESLLRDRGRTAACESSGNSEKDLTEAERRLESLASENRNLRNSLAAKEKLAETLSDRKSQIESEFEALMRRLDSVEKENAFLRYEYRVLEKDLEARTKEIEYSRRSIDSAHKQQLKSVNKIVELESECQRLRLLIRKKFPEATILLQPKLRNDAEERKMEMRRRNANLQNDLATGYESRSRKIHHDALIEQNKNLKEIIMKKDAEIRDLSRRQKQRREIQELGISPFRSSAPRDGKLRNSGAERVTRASEMSLYMEDFAEMEKLSIVSTDKNPRDDEDDRPFDWLQAVLCAVTKQQRISKRSVRELLQDIKIALGCVDDDDASSKDSKHPEAEPTTPLCIAWKSPSQSSDSGAMTKEEIKRHLGLGTKRDLERSENPKDMAKKIDSESEELRLKLKESEEKIRTLEAEVKTLRGSKDAIEAEMEAERSVNEELDTELGVTRAKLNETHQKLSSLEVELDFRKSCCEELEGTCLELQLQLESMEKKDQVEENKKKTKNSWDVNVASMKLAECQETIQNLRKQLKALALPSSLSALSSETRRIKKLSSKGSSLRDHMLLEDNTKKPQNDDDDDDDGKNCNALIVYTPRVYSVRKEEEKRDEVTTMAAVKSREKEGFGFFKKLLFRKRRGTGKKCLALTL